MQIITCINNAKCLEWGLNANQGALFDMLNQSASWAKTVVIDGEVWYWVSRNKVIEELPLYYTKPDTVYRHLKALDKNGLIKHQKHGDKDLIMLTEKGKTWNNKVVDNLPQNNSNNDDKNSSDSNPTLGNKSENTRIQIRNSSDSNPTYQHTNSSAVNNQSVSKEFSKLEKPREEKKPTPEKQNRYIRGHFWVFADGLEKLQADYQQSDIDDYIGRYNRWVDNSGKQSKFPIVSVRKWMEDDGIEKLPSQAVQALVAKADRIGWYQWTSEPTAESYHQRIARWFDEELDRFWDFQSNRFTTAQARQRAKELCHA